MSKKPKFVLCSHSQRPEGDQQKCGWRGRAEKYRKHLAEKHGGEEYKVPEVGIPLEEPLS